MSAGAGSACWSAALVPDRHPPVHASVAGEQAEQSETETEILRWVKRDLPIEQRAEDADGYANVFLGDINGDGLTDIIECRNTIYNNKTSMHIILGNSSKKLTKSSKMPENIAEKCITATFGDIDKDNVLDMISTTSSGVSVLKGNRDGSFRPESMIFELGTTNIANIAFGDVNNDVLLDVAAEKINTIFLNQGKGTFGNQIPLPISDMDKYIQTTSSKIKLSDLNNDAILDILLFTYSIESIHPDIEILIGKGDGTFTNKHIPNESTWTSSEYHTKDINNDGIIDLISHNKNQILLGNGDGSFQNPIMTQTSFSEIKPIRIEDLNGDGILDMVE